MTTQAIDIPDHIAKRIAQRKAGQGAFSAIAEAFAGVQGPPVVSIKGSKFRLKEGGVETLVGSELDVIIIAANPANSKVFYREKYTSDSTAGPDCSSANGITPDAHIAEPVCSSCAKCPNNVLGSAVTNSGAKSKLCGDVRYIAVVPAGDPNKVYAMNLPVTSMKPMREYVQELGNYGLAVEEVITKLGFDDAEFPRLTFTRGAFIPQKALEQLDDMKATPEVKAAIRADVPAHALPSPAPAAAEETKAVAAIKEEAPKPKPVEAKAAPKPEPVKEEAATVTSDDDLESALDGLFD